MTLVVDASVVVSALVVSGSDGDWAEEVLSRGSLNAPHLMPVEVASVLRRSAAAGSTSEHMATQAHHDIGRLRVALYPYEVTADRVWELRHSVSPYDAWYVALAEALDAPLATLDRRMAQADGPRCEFLTPA